MTTPPDNTKAHLASLGVAAGIAAKTGGEYAFNHYSTRIIEATKNGGEIVFDYSLGFLDHAVRVIPGQLADYLSTLILQTMRKTGEAIAFCSDTERNPRMTALLPFALATAAGLYATFKFREIYKPTMPTTGNAPPRRLIVFGKIPPKSQQNKRVITGANIVQLDNKLEIKDLTLQDQDISWWNIPLSKTRLGFVNKEIGNIATNLLKGSVAATVALPYLGGAIGRFLDLNLGKPGITGLIEKPVTWSIGAIADLPIHLTHFAGGLIANTSSLVVKTGLSTGFTIGAFYVWSTIQLSGAEHGLFDWEQKGWARLDKWVALKTLAKAVAGCVLMGAAVAEVREILPFTEAVVVPEVVIIK
jgi:hypothetical protein